MFNTVSLAPSVTKFMKGISISSHLIKSIDTGNLYLGPLHIIDQIIELEIISKSPVTILPADCYSLI